MSDTQYSSLLDSSLASPLEKSLEGSLYIDEMEELKRKRQLLSDGNGNGIYIPHFLYDIFKCGLHEQG